MKFIGLNIKEVLELCGILIGCFFFINNFNYKIIRRKVKEEIMLECMTRNDCDNKHKVTDIMLKEMRDNIIDLRETTKQILEAILRGSK